MYALRNEIIQNFRDLFRVSLGETGSGLAFVLSSLAKGLKMVIGYYHSLVADLLHYISLLVLTLTLPGPSAGVGGSLTVTVA